MGSRLCSTSGALASSFCGEWRRNGARGERRQRGVGRTPAADPQPEACATSGQRDPVPQLYFSLLLPRDVVWRVPVGTGVLSVLSRPCWITGPLHPQTSQIWCCNCRSLPSGGEADDTLRSPHSGHGTDLLCSIGLLLADFSNFVAYTAML